MKAVNIFKVFSLNQSLNRGKHIDPLDLGRGKSYNVFMNCFLNKKPDFEKLVRFGFVQKDGAYAFTKLIFDGQFELLAEVSDDGEVRTKVTDLATGEPYTLHLVESAGGAFVGAVRAEYRQTLEEISEKCFVKEVFKSPAAKEIIGYAAEKYGDGLEFLWKDLPDAAVLRRADSKKWYAVFMTVERRRLGFNEEGKTEIADLHALPEDIQKLTDGKKFLPAYHMNKKHWITVILDAAPAEEICEMLDKSYALAKK